MKHVVHSSEITKIDAVSQKEFALPGLSLMESAAMGVWSEVQARIPTLDCSLVFLCGGGNNGGDALAVARLAYNSGFRSLLCVLTGKRLSSSCERQQKIIEKYGISLITVGDTIPDRVREAITQADFLFDGLAGTGLQGPLRGLALSLVELAIQSSAYKIAIDIPSGISEDVVVSSPHFKADLTVTFALHKMAMFHPLTRSDAGEIVIRNPSFPPQLLKEVPVTADLCTLSELSLEKLSSSSYKNKRGHLGIVGGSKEYSGAARLSARSAFSSRAGLVTLFCDEDVYPIAASESPSVMVRILEDEEDFSSYDALLVGPGWGSGHISLLEKIFSSGKRIVLDADGITTYASLLKEHKRVTHGPLIITPHLGELKRLASAFFEDLPEDTPSAFFTMIQKIADRLDATLVVKSSLVHIASPGQIRITIIEGLNPSLGVAGSGDVLSGIIAALVGGGMEMQTASLTGALLHQQAGLVAHAKYGYYDSETLIECLGRIVRGAEQ